MRRGISAPMIALLVSAAAGPVEAAQPAGATYNPPPPETEEERNARYAKAQEAEKVAERLRELRRAEALEAKRAMEEQALVQLASDRHETFRCARCDSTGTTTRHKNGRPASPHACPDCRAARKNWFRQHPGKRP